MLCFDEVREKLNRNMKKKLEKPNVCTHANAKKTQNLTNGRNPAQGHPNYRKEYGNFFLAGSNQYIKKLL